MFFDVDTLLQQKDCLKLVFDLKSKSLKLKSLQNSVLIVLSVKFIVAELYRRICNVFSLSWRLLSILTTHGSNEISGGQSTVAYIETWDFNLHTKITFKGKARARSYAYWAKESTAVLNKIILQEI